MSGAVVYWESEVGLLGRVRLAESTGGLCKIALGLEDDADFHAWIVRVMDPHELANKRTPRIEQALNELDAYVSGQLQAFTIPRDLRGTAFQRTVWDAITQVPYGATVTYGEIAQRIGHPRAVRAVGAANGANPLPLFVPCHRVVGADGALRGYGGGLELKEALLQLEGALVLYRNSV